jgi:hypothetical protein
MTRTEHLPGWVVKKKQGPCMNIWNLPRTVNSVLIASMMLATGCQTIDDRPAKWSYLHTAIIAPSCATAGCHSALTAAAGVNLADRQGAYTILTGRICGGVRLPQEPPGNYVVPGSAEFSQLMYQLEGQSADGRPFRDVMPPDLPLPDVEVALVARWIDAGALCD